MQEPSFVHWRTAIRDHRKLRGLSIPALATRSGLSASAIKAYESGARQPTAASLSSLIDALGLTREEANPIRAGAGFAVDWYTVLNERFTSDLDWLLTSVHCYPWPVFVANQGFDVVAANQPLAAVMGIDLVSDLLRPGERNWLGQASNPQFVECVINYDELVTFMIGLSKADPRFTQNPERPAPWLEAPLQRFLQGDPKYIKRFLDLWEKAEPIPHRTRHLYEVRWLHQGKQPLHFLATLTIGDLWNELSWNDWLPADASTWEVLSQLTPTTAKSQP